MTWKRTRRTSRFWAGLALALFLLTVPQVNGQSSNASSILDQAGELQSKLVQLRQTLSNLNFTQIPAGPTRAQRSVLDRERAACLAWVGTLNHDIAAVQSSPTLANEVQLALDNRRFSDAVGALYDSLDSLPGDMSPVQGGGWERLRSELGSMGWNFNEGLLMRQLDAIGAKPTASKLQVPGEISGHVYRADNGKPLAGVTVMLEVSGSFGSPVRSTQTAADGAYSFPDVAPGNYQVGGYRAGFDHGYYGPHFPSQLWATLSLAPGQNRSDIDMRLDPTPSVMQMDAETLFKDYPGEEISMFGTGSDGRFSPDGRLFAFTVFPLQVWIYDLRSQRLTPAIEQVPAGVPDVNIGWVGNTLYADFSNDPQFAKFNNGNGPDVLFAATVQGTREVQTLPSAAKEALREDWMHQLSKASNGRFVVTVKLVGHGMVALIARPANGQGTVPIAGGGGELESFILEPQRSLVLYPTEGPPYAIATYDLNARKRQLTYLPNGAQRLVDAAPDSSGYLVAYISNGPCRGYSSGTGFYLRPAFVVEAPSNLCFAKIPWVAQK